jgi:hypothetical protein
VIAVLIAALVGGAAPEGAGPDSRRRNAVVEIVEQVAPAVVNISTEQQPRLGRALRLPAHPGLGLRPAGSVRDRTAEFAPPRFSL